MDVIARIFGVSLLGGGLAAGLGYGLFATHGDCSLPCFLLGCVGAVVGALAGTARETVVALRQKPSL